MCPSDSLSQRFQSAVESWKEKNTLCNSCVFLRTEDVWLANGFLVQGVPICSPGEFPQKLSVNVAWNSWRTGIQKQAPTFDAGKP